MTYYRTCPRCGSNLDPGERCTCQDKKETAQGAANTQSGEAKRKVCETNCFALSLSENKGECQDGKRKNPGKSFR